MRSGRVGVRIVSRMDSVTRLVLVRHGESRATVDRMVGGHEGCRGLTEQGRRQAQALADRLARTGELADASVLLTSVLPRAVETAEIVAPALGGLEVEQNCNFCEFHIGEADGLSWEEFRERYRPEEHLHDRFRPLAPGAESWATFFARVGTALAGVAAEHAGSTVVVVCHGGVIEGSFIALGNLPLRRSFDVAIGNTSLTEWMSPAEVETGGRCWKLVRFNDTAHLTDVDRR
ncbi:MAG: histidine phosphatase family protein [Actinomycetota bacterium]|nr:histidine phosphatase family protein [Actinomycetota bacterium]